MKRALSLIVAVGIFAGSARAAEDETFVSATQAYNENRFQDAVDGYERLVQAGKWNATLFYDLGNAYYRVGTFGKAILNYERALALEPRHPEAQANLRLASDEARALELKRDWIERYAGIGTVKQYSIGAAIAFWVALFIAAHLWLARRRSAAGLALIAISLSLCGASVYAVYTLENGTRGRTLAVVTAKEVEARLATADNAKSILLLPAGSEVRIVSERGGWIYVALPNDQRGWIPAASAERVRL